MERKMIYFQCYSMPLKAYLDSKNIKSEFKAKNCKNDKVFYFYLYDTENKLAKALNEWGKRKESL